MNTYEPVASGTGKSSETATPTSQELFEFRMWQSAQKAEAEKKAAAEKAAKAEADRTERDERIASAVYRHQVKRAKRSFVKGAEAATAIGLAAAAVSFIIAMGADTFSEE